LTVDGIGAHYQLVLAREGALDELVVQCEPADERLDRGELGARAAGALREATGIGRVPRSEGKAVRVVDLRDAGAPVGTPRR